MLPDQIKGNIDVKVVSKTQIDGSFPYGNFL